MGELVDKNDLTQGVIWKKLLFFAMPLLATSFIQQLYHTVDIIYVGNFLGKEAAAAVGSSSLLVTCLVGFFSGISLGASVVTSYACGNNNKRDLNKTIHTAIWLGFYGGIAITLIGIIGAPYFLELINTPEEIMGMAVSYIRIYFISIVSILTYNMGSGIIRAMGNSKTPMVIQLIGGMANIVTNAIFLIVFKSGIVGVAWATFFSQSFAAALILYYLLKNKLVVYSKEKKTKVDKKTLALIFKIGLPSGVQALLITLSNVFVQFYVNSLGIDVIAAFTAYFKIELLIFLPILAFGQAMTTFTSQNIGAKKYDRVKKGTRICLFMAIFTSIVLSTVLMIYGRTVFGLVNHEISVVSLGLEIIAITFPFYFIYAILEVLAGTIRGAGKTLPTMVIILTNIFVLRSTLLFLIMQSSQNIGGIAVTYPITWATTSLGIALYYWKGNWLGEFDRLLAVKLESSESYS